MSRVAIIPARGGSKRIPHKNIKPFLGAPMLHWPIAAARAAQLFDRIVVSTDDAEIADCARAAGAEALMRPADLADDVTGVVPVIRHALGTIAEADTACLIYATAPFLLARAPLAHVLLPVGIPLRAPPLALPSLVPLPLVLEVGERTLADADV